MKKTKLKSQELIKKSLTLADSVKELNNLIEKIFVLSGDVFENYIEKIDFKTERGKQTAEIDFNIIKVMIDVMHSYIFNALEISRYLPELSEDILETLKKE